MPVPKVSGVFSNPVINIPEKICSFTFLMSHLSSLFCHFK